MATKFARTLESERELLSRLPSEPVVGDRPRDGGEMVSPLASNIFAMLRTPPVLPPADVLRSPIAKEGAVGKETTERAE